MKVLARRAGAIALLGLLLAVPGVMALGECADFISSGAREGPVTGELVGQRTVTSTRSSSYTSSWSARLLGGSFTYNQALTSSYSVGVYRMSNGETREIRCDTYRYA